MDSKVKELATAKGVKNPQQLSYVARITWPTANSVWTGDISNTRVGTLQKVAAALGCRVDDLFASATN
ncbi:MAG: helix-turn-helix transcriptional regulator [Gammaproteobacteria bacterium]